MCVCVCVCERERERERERGGGEGGGRTEAIGMWYGNEWGSKNQPRRDLVYFKMIV